MTIVEAAARILEREGGPLHLRGIHNLISARGAVDTPDPVGVVARKIREATARNRSCDCPILVEVAPNTLVMLVWAAQAGGGDEAFRDAANGFAEALLSGFREAAWRRRFRGGAPSSPADGASE